MINKYKTDELRKFGIINSILIFFVFYFVIPYFFSREKESWPIYVSSLLMFFGITFPILLMPIYKAWIFVGRVLGYINSRILLSIIFYLLITPLAILLKLLGKQPIKTNKDVDSYRVNSSRHDKSHMERPY